jgi:hypothetical protein
VSSGLDDLGDRMATSERNKRNVLRKELAQRTARIKTINASHVAGKSVSHSGKVKSTYKVKPT